MLDYIQVNQKQYRKPVETPAGKVHLSANHNVDCTGNNGKMNSPS